MYQSTNRASNHGVRGTAALALAVVLASACATAPLAPTAALTAAQDSIARAEEAGARQHAGAELDEAQQKLQLAERSVRNEQMTDAERLAQESMVTAQLATARTEAAKAAEINREMVRSADALREEMQRRGERQ